MLQQIKYMNLIAQQDSELLYEYRNKLEHIKEDKKSVIFRSRKNNLFEGKINTKEKGN